MELSKEEATNILAFVNRAVVTLANIEELNVYNAVRLKLMRIINPPAPPPPLGEPPADKPPT